MGSTYEKDIQFSVGPVFGFRKSEEAVGDGDEIGTQPEPAAKRPPVPCLRAQHSGC
jgi:hypothetical protein